MSVGREMVTRKWWLTGGAIRVLASACRVAVPSDTAGACHATPLQAPQSLHLPRGKWLDTGAADWGC
jgi:hypothetical protein